MAGAVAGGAALIATTGGVGLVAAGGIGLDVGEGVAATGIGIAESGDAAGGLTGGAQAIAGQGIARAGSSIMWAGAELQATGLGWVETGTAFGYVATGFSAASTLATCATRGFVTLDCAGSTFFTALGGGSLIVGSGLTGWAAIGNVIFGASTNGLGDVSWHDLLAYSCQWGT